ncbi:FAD-dependent oxidoreductase [Nakamurella sp. YIM 132087]|uniref:FAD-dependent oxidoreductase n=1 Tax=Nakamurella alba TaxID=2665158 RepID=A0A7K1FKE8_9ACTN|nr:FAD-dependent oxidoreductase [Nakamurella alba]MTD14615.1 FAD-dependent oxidoreductase [Nakamurella alba]
MTDTTAAAVPHAIVSGASIAGLSTAFWLRRIGWQVTVLERTEEFREGGQNIDVRGVAREVLRRTGLFDAVKAQNTTETGTVLVDADGSVHAELPSDDPDGATAELEVLRGDLAKVLRDALPPGEDIRFGDPIACVRQDGDAVTVTTEAGESLTADLLVIAEGVRSSTRALVFPDAVDPRDLHITMAFGTIPRIESDDNTWRWYTAPGGRQVHLRPDNHGTTRAILAFADEDKDHPVDLTDSSREDALAWLRERFADAGWQVERVLDGFDTSEDVYIDRLTQIRMDTWHRGRVCVLGDSGWCVTPMGGGGSSLALTAGYVLAAQIAQIPAGSGTPDREELTKALQRWEEWMRPLVDDVQTLPPGLDHFAYPRTALGVKIRAVVDRIVMSGPLKPLVAKITHVADDDRELPAIDLHRS